MKKSVLLAILFLSACATVKPVYVRDGIQVYSATCNGLIRDISDCYALASQQCAGKFEVINTIENKYENIFEDKSEIKKTTYTEDSKTTYKLDNGFPTMPIINRSLFFYCK